MIPSPFKFLGRLWLFLLILSISMPVKAQPLKDSGPPAFRDGEWVGNFGIKAQTTTAVMMMDTTYNGDMNLIASGGQVNGDWKLKGYATYTGDIFGSASFAANGTVGGTSIEPILSTNKFMINMDITVAGMQTEQSVDMGSGGKMGLTLVSATCNQVVADIKAPVTSGYEQAGMASNVSGSFVAVRVSDLQDSDLTDYQQEVGDLLDEAETFKQQAIANQSIDFETLNQLVKKAENLGISLKKNADCGQGGNKLFLTSITLTVTDLAYFALQNPELFTTEELSRLVTAALAVGAMGSGAANPSQAADLTSKFTQEFNNRLSDAQTNKNCSEATQIKVTALMLNNAALKQQAESVISAVC